MDFAAPPGGVPDGGQAQQGGCVARWSDRGYGFIKPDSGEEDVFCHFSGITDGNALHEGDAVVFEAMYDERKGKFRAENVTGGVQQDRALGGGGAGGPGAAWGKGKGKGGGGVSGGGQQVCFDFQRGSCTRGDACRFSHDGGFSAGGGGYGKGGGGKGGQQVCFDFQRGACTRGDGCRYLHQGGETVDYAPPPYAPQQYGPPQGYGGAPAGYGPPQGQYAPPQNYGGGFPGAPFAAQAYAYQGMAGMRGMGPGQW